MTRYMLDEENSKSHRHGDDFPLDQLREQLQAGLDALDRGSFIEVGDADLDATLDGLAASPLR
ncbi:hypothetical protein HNR60_004205 [Rhodopseudomonas rhenobacensis]|uniref:Uncharacterized protein n=1 Tax=Rhodopseudomonas rhenobacensis TaxID=87461 RepID=A0A7W8E0Y8_9BRAD|nr:hypothetical protein [Rhodopseudomonas rhenobacensis]MBB5049427.1 hypothetical protein [Rhodopseudomonas rhenobacensis]